MRNKLLLVAFFALISAALHIYNFGFPCLNSDEAAFGYNTFSLIQTGKDEYGSFLPTRLKSFGENKLPLMAYLSAPFVAVMGLSELSTRIVVILIGIASPFLLYALTRQLINNAAVAVIAAFLGSVSPWIQITTRHAHEGMLAYFFTTLALFFFLKFHNSRLLKHFILFTVSMGLALFSHHNAKIFIPFFLLAIPFTFPHMRKNISGIIKHVIIFLIPVAFLLITELLYPTNRIATLTFFNNPGFTLNINQERAEHNVHLIHNKLTESVTTLTNQYLSYFSPEFLVINGDQNPKFGLPGLSPITPIEYLFIFIGMYYLFRNKEKYKYLILALLLASPLTASLSWQEYSLSRSFYMIVPMLILASYGVVNLYKDIPFKRNVIISILGAAYLFFLITTWDFYFFHYPKRALASREWQCGYKELGTYIKDNYSKFDKFYITKQHGQPYIYTLFYTQYPPKKYQSQASITGPDKYGFGQVERYDKFEFSLPFPPKKDNSVYVGYPHDFIDNSANVDMSKIKKITFENEEMFWIYEDTK